MLQVIQTGLTIPQFVMDASNDASVSGSIIEFVNVIDLLNKQSLVKPVLIVLTKKYETRGFCYFKINSFLLQ